MILTHRLSLYISLTFIAICCFSNGALSYNMQSDEHLHIYVVPHSHNDPGWWNTFEDYYTTWTRGIISSIIQVLDENRDRRFIWAEISFFQRWWIEQPDDVKNTVKRLVNDKQLEFVTGGWVMNDEANTHLIDIINQLTEGHEWLYNTLGVKPTVGWSIDPFGHSSTMPYVLQAMGFKSMVINRIHKDRKNEFRTNKRLEFFWESENSETGPDYHMLTHVFPYKLYDIPNTCGPSWDTCEKFDFERPVSIAITQANVAERSKVLLDQYRQKAAFFPHNHVLIPLGDDFKYKTFDMTKKIMTQYEMMFEYINSDPSLKATVKFATLSDYLSAVEKWNDDAQSLPSFKGDFFTYCDEDQDYWSGYFTTRPFMKGLTRTTQSVLRTGESLFVLERSITDNDNDKRKGWFEAIEKSRSNLGIFQHHDGVTGTARVKVVQDYAHRLHDSLWGVADAATQMVSSLLQKQTGERMPTSSLVWSYTQPDGPMLVPAPRVLPLSSGTGVVVVYNSLQHPRKEVVSVYVSTKSAKVTDADGTPIQAQIEPVWNDRTVANDRFTLYFVAKVPAFGFATYFIAEDDVDTTTHATIKEYAGNEAAQEESIANGAFKSKRQSLSAVSGVNIRNQQYTVTFSEGGIKNLKRTVGGQDLNVDLKQEFLSYNTHRSGAYLFLPNGPASNAMRTSYARIIEGPLVKTAVFALDSAPIRDVVIRLYDCEGTESCSMADMVELMHTLDLERRFSNTEVITRYSTDIANNNVFYTDSNGLDMRKRTYVSHQPIQANYYPITSAAYLEDTNSRLTLLSHEAHGAGSLASGAIEVMLDRRLNQDDARGLGEPVQDNVRTPVPIWLILESTPANAALTPVATAVWQRRNYPLQQYYTKDPVSSVADYSSKHHLSVSSLRVHIPSGVEVMSLAPRNSFSDEVLMRVYTPPSSDATSTSTYNLDLDLFSRFTPKDVRRMTLSMMYEESDTSLSVSLKPAEIQTFVFTIEPHEPTGDLQFDDSPRFDNIPLTEAPDINVPLPQIPEKVDKENALVVDKNNDKGGDMRKQSKDIPQFGEPKDGQEDVDHNNLPQDEAIKQAASGDGKKPGKQPGSRPTTPTKNNNYKREKEFKEEEPKSTNLYTFSILVYLGLAICMFVSGYAVRSKKGSLFSWRSQPLDEREASVMKML